MVHDGAAYLREAGVGLDSDLRIVDAGRVVCCVGLLATLYFTEGGTAPSRERFARALDLYLRAAGKGLVWGATSADPAYRPVSSSSAANPRSWMVGFSPQKEVEVKLHGGKEVDDASSYFVRAKARSLAPNELSYLSFGLPFAWITEHTAGAFIRFIFEVCDALAPAHGYAGLAPIGSVELRRQQPQFAALIALGARFRGLEIDVPQSHNIYLAKEQRIKGINWLTVLDESWVEKLGGRGALAAALGDGVQLHPFRTGVVIQAGPRPMLGDVNRNEPMPTYRQVALTLKPIRIDSVKAISADFGFDEERSDQWLARFDD